MLVIGNFSDTRRIKPVKAMSSGKHEEAKSKDSTPNLHLVQIPPFHTGHLGFVPHKTVLLTGPLPQEDARGVDKRTCEVVVTPHAIGRDILKVSCTFDEGKHVLERLVNLLSHLNVNIVALESASVFDGKYHIVHMVLDMAQSILSDKAMTDGERSKFIDVLPNLRISNRRGLELFLFIIVQCHNILRWKEGPGSRERYIPQVFVSEYDEREWTGQTERAPIFRGEVSYRRSAHVALEQVDEDTAPRKRKAHETYFELPKARGKRIETLLGIAPQLPLDYLLLSDTESRSLRIQFFQAEHRQQIFELGFKHQNEIGALYTILSVVADSNFNVLSCLIRETEEYENVWEAVLEYQGPPENLEDLPADPRKAMKKLLHNAAKESKDELSPYEVEIFIPSHLPDAAKYKDIGVGWNNSLPIDGDDKKDANAKHEIPTQPYLLSSETKGPVERDWLISYANDLLFAGPKIFISCSSHDNAIKYRQYLQKELDKRGWKTSVYADLARLDLTYAEAKQLIADADYLVGIWLPDEPEERSESTSRVESPAAEPDKASATRGRRKPVAPGTAKLSPWMHFEMGLAVAFDREFKILASKSLDTTGVVRRIAGDRPVFRFTEGSIKRHFGECVTSLLAFMDLNWRKGGYLRVERPPEPSSQSS